MTRRFLLAALTLLVVGSSVVIAAPEPEARAADWGWNTATHVDQILPMYMGGGLELAVVPTPQREVRSHRLFAIGRPVIVVPGGGVAASVRRDLAELFPGVDLIEASAFDDAAAGDFVVIVGDGKRNAVSKRVLEAVRATATDGDREQLGVEGYQLFVGREPGGRVVIVLGGATAAGDFWAVQTLRQLLVDRGDRRWVTGAWMLDWPGYPRRGSKGARDYMPAYKDNFSWGPPTPEMLANFGHGVAYLSTSPVIDCSSEGIARIETAMRAAFDAGAREFALKFDDRAVAMEESTAARFATYGAAVCHLFREIDRRAKALEPSSRLFYLPQHYHTSADYRGLAREIREAGGLPADVGMVWTGPEVFSPTIDLEDCRRYMEAFGCTATRGLIYDNHLRETDYAPLRGRDGSLTEVLAGIFSERSSQLTRITRCDYNWNPQAYDPNRSLKLACREMVRCDPRAYRALYGVVTQFDRIGELPPELSRDEKLARTRHVTATLSRLIGPLEEALPGESIVTELKTAIDVRVRKQSRLEAAGYREARAVRCDAPPKIDGRPDEAAWIRSPKLTNFLVWDQANWTKLGPAMGRPVPAARQTTVRILYDDTAVYLSAVAQSDQRIEDAGCCDLAKRGQEKHGHGKIWWPHVDRSERDVYGVWHTPSIELFLAPGRDRVNTVHMIANVAGLTYDKYGRGRAPASWNPEWKTEATRDADGKGFTVEIAIPFAAFGRTTPKKGEVWGLNVCRTWPGHQMWTFVWGPKGFNTPEDFGTLRFD